eukprot:scaffold11772_cov183-Skeletonema_marinoi.AAC.4
MSSVETLAPTLQLDEFEDLKGNLGRYVHYFLLFVVDVVVIGSIAWGPSFLLVVVLSGVLSDKTDVVEAVSSLDDEDLLLVIAVRTCTCPWLADANMPVAIRFPIPCTVAGDDEEFIGVYCWVLTNSPRSSDGMKAGMETRVGLAAYLARASNFEH